MQIRELRAEREDPTVHYPDCYVQPFHAHEEGSLDCRAAFEVESATYSMALCTVPGGGPVFPSRRSAACATASTARSGCGCFPCLLWVQPRALRKQQLESLLPAAACGQRVGACWALGRVRWTPT